MPIIQGKGLAALVNAKLSLCHQKVKPQLLSKHFISNRRIKFDIKLLSKWSSQFQQLFRFDISSYRQILYHIVILRLNPHSIIHHIKANQMPKIREDSHSSHIWNHNYCVSNHYNSINHLCLTFNLFKSPFQSDISNYRQNLKQTPQSVINHSERKQIPTMRR